jgi:glycosyltransferase involved in cell wall biosynthesis
LNIVLTTDYFPPHIGGVETVTYELARQLSQMGHKVAVITLSTDNKRPVESISGMRVYEAKSHESTRLLGVQSAFSSATGRLIRNVCRREAADILHANNLYYFTTIAATANKKSLKLPLVTTLHIGTTSLLDGGVRVLTKLYEKSVGRWILSRSDHIIAVSNAVKSYARALNVADSKISVIPNGIDIHENRPNPTRRKEDARVRVAFVGRLISNKGPQYLVEAAPTVLRDFPAVEFLIVGEGPMLDALRSRARALGVSDSIRFLRAVPSVSAFLRECDLYVRPSLTEGMPLTVLEAMASGVPTIATCIEGTTEILAHGNTGFLVDPKNVDQLRFYISRLVGDSKLRMRMGKRAREIMEKHNDWVSVATQTSRVYESVLTHSS